MRRNKNDPADASAFSPRACPAGAIGEAVSRPAMRFVAIKSEAQQAAAGIHKACPGAGRGARIA